MPTGKPEDTGRPAARVGGYRWLRAAAGPAAKTLLHRSGAYRALRRLRPSRKLAVLRYHAICGRNGYRYADPSICISPQAFERQVRYLVANYDVLSLPEAIEAIRAHRRLPANAVAITFDDGYADNLPAARLLHQLGASATFYITAGCLAGGEPFWLSEIRELILRIMGPVVRMSIDGRLVEIPCSGAGAQQTAIRSVSRLFKSHPITVREELRSQLRAQAGVTTIPSAMLTWSDLAEMRRLGMTIGAHTLTHPNLPSAGLAAARDEIVGSKERLERELGHPVTMFSYPNGGAEQYYTPEIREIVINAGFRAAATSWNGFAGPDSDPYALERIQVAERIEDLVFALEVERFAFAPEN